MALSAPASRTGNKGPTVLTFGCKAKATKVFYARALVMKGTDGYLIPAAKTAGGKVVGITELVNKDYVDTTGLADGDETIITKCGIFPFAIASGVDALTIADEGTDVYVYDDQTVAKTDGGVGAPVAGQLFLIDGTTAWVGIGISTPGATRAGAIPDTIAAAGALSLVEHTLASVTGTTAYTLADGTRIGQVKRVTCVAGASSPNATITPATPYGFATVSAIGAIGDYVEFVWTLVAGVPKWVLRASQGVTIA